MSTFIDASVFATTASAAANAAAAALVIIDCFASFTCAIVTCSLM